MFYIQFDLSPNETKFTFCIKIHIFIKYFCLGLQLV